MTYRIYLDVGPNDLAFSKTFEGCFPLKETEMRSCFHEEDIWDILINAKNFFEVFKGWLPFMECQITACLSKTILEADLMAKFKCLISSYGYFSPR